MRLHPNAHAVCSFATAEEEDIPQWDETTSKKPVVLLLPDGQSWFSSATVVSKLRNTERAQAQIHKGGQQKQNDFQWDEISNKKAVF